MIKHGKIHQFYGHSTASEHSHLEPIKKHVTKGIADAREKVILQPLACDVRGAKKFDGQQCVIAKALSRVHKPQAVAVGRSVAYAVFDGLAVRFKVPEASRHLIEEFDSSGRVRKAPIELHPIQKSWRLGSQSRSGNKPRKAASSKQKRRSPTKKYGVRAIGGGISA